MKCPHCVTTIKRGWKAVGIGEDKDGNWSARWYQCPACDRLVIELVLGAPGDGLIFPAWPHSIRRPLPTEVDERFATQFQMACAILADSPQASAALSRRCLRRLLRERVEVEPATLAEEIEELLGRGELPPLLAADVEAVRAVGDFASHSSKSERPAEITAVEPGEAEWLIDVLEALFDFYFVQPAAAEKRRGRLQQNARASEPALEQTDA